jgi:hypothetical protein
MTKSLLLLGLAALFIGCPGSDPLLGDAGAGTTLLPGLRDGGLPPLHDGGSSDDAGAPAEDAGAPDAGAPAEDAGAPDAGAPDGGPPEASPEDGGGILPLLVSPEGGPCFLEGLAFCEAGLVCAPLYASGAGTCARACAVEGQACAGGGTCVDYGPTGEPALVCADEVASGAGCDVENLVVCGDDGLCLPNDQEPLGGTCRTRCSCQSGESCSSSACSPETCVVTSFATGAGFCGTPAPVGASCAPITEGVFCEGNAVCLLEATGAGTCRQRCPDLGAVCPGLPDSAVCFGSTSPGYCLPTVELGQGEVCTDGSTTPVTPLTCASSFGCISFESLPAGLGLCLEDCSDVSGECSTGECYDLGAQAPTAGLRCLTELPRGTRGCGLDAPEPFCEGGASAACVRLVGNDSICKLLCTLANCPAGEGCECPADESCIDSYLSSAVLGVCGQLAERGEACKSDADVYCAPAPGEDVETNAFSACLAEECRFVCRYESQGTAVELACPADLVCAPDPTGRLLPTVHLCREP